MSERCKNCDSTDIVEIQGQKFCINCGEPYTAEPAAVPAKEAKVAVSVAPTPKPPVKKVEKKATKPAKEATKPVVSAAPPLDLRKQPVVAAPHAEPEKPLVVKSKQENQKYQQASTPLSARESITDHRPEPSPDKRPHPLGFSFKVASLVAVPVAGAIGAVVWFRFDFDTVLYVAATCAVLAFAFLSLAQAAILYGMSRAYDHRPAPRKQWWAAARSGIMDIINIDLMTVILILVTVGAAAAGWQGLAALELPDWAEIGLLLVLNAFAAWLLLGAAIARHIAIPATVIGGMSSTQTYRLGWQTFLKAGGSLSLALVQAWTARIIVLVAGFFVLLYFGQHLTDYNHTIGALIIAGCVWLFTMLLFVTALQLEARVWLRHYRYWIARCFPQRQLRLLAGRVQTLRHR